MNPSQSYRIWFTPRTGSTLLCKGLEETKIAGKPGEFFNVPADSSLCEMHNVDSYHALQQKIWHLGSSTNGVFGIKHSSFNDRNEQIYKEICHLKQLKPSDPIELQNVLKDLFPNCKHIYLTRRNKIRQAVSWWKAIKDEQWHIAKGEEKRNTDTDFYEKEYVYPAIRHLTREALLRECSIGAYFKHQQIQPLTIVYEDMVQDFNGTLRRILAYLALDDTQAAKVTPYYRPTATAESEKWVQRFRQEWQEEQGKISW